MQTKTFAILASLLLVAGYGNAQTTAFTYQGRLASSNSPASGLYDLQFTLYNAVTSGGVVGGPVTNTAVGVTNGLFTTLIDFGNAPFNGNDLWLEVGLRTNAVATFFATLRPRQRITTSPFAIRAASVADGAITASKLSSGGGANGQVLKMNGGVLAWGTDLNSGGGVSSVGSGTGLTGGPITTSGTLSIDTTLVPRMNAANTFTGSNTFNGVIAMTNVTNRFVGAFVGNGAGLSNVIASATNANVTLAGDVTGTTAASTVARIRGVNVASITPLAGQLLRNNGTSWAPSAVALATDVSGSLPVANGGTGASTATAARTSLGTAASGPNSDITSLSGLTTPLSAAQGGSGQATYTIGDILYASGSSTLSRLPDVLTGNALISGGAGVAPAWGKIGLSTHVTGSLPVSNGGTGSSTAAGARAGLGAAASGANLDITSLGGLTTPLSPAQGGSGQSSYTIGDLLYASGGNALSKLSDVAAGSALISGGAGVAPAWGKIGLATHVIGTLSAANGGSGQSGYAVGDLLFASGTSTLARRSIGPDGQVLGSSGGLPTWVTANSHNHLGQTWTGVASDGLFIQNDSNASGASALTGSATDTVGINYGVYGQTLSQNGIGVQGSAFADTGVATGVSGQSTSSGGIGVYGLASASTGTPTGVYGEASSTNGVGVYGIGTGSTGVPVGVYGEAVSATGYGLYTPNRLFVGGTAFIGGHISMQPIARIFADIGSASAPSVSFGSNSTSGIFSPATNTLSFTTAAAERLRITSDGKVGIARIPLTNLLEIGGEASKNTAGGWFANSDARIKTEIHGLTNALATIEQLHPVTFRYKQQYLDAHPTIEDKKYYNVIAQEFAKVFPDSVKESGETLDGRPVLQVDTHPAMMCAIAALQELHHIVTAKDSELARLKEQNASLEKRLSALEKLTESLKKDQVAREP